MTEHDVDVLAIGAGPANLALAVALEESGSPDLARNTLILEQHPDIKWQRNLLLPWARSQVSFLKDLVTLRNPRSRFSFLNFLHERGRLDDFVNLATFNPYRWELSEYQQWVAHHLEHVGLRYNARVERIEPRRTRGGHIDGWTVVLTDGDRITCRDLVFGTGRDPHIPDVFAALPADRVIHSTQYNTRIAEVAATRGERALRPVVVGGAQSAAEMFMAVHTDLPNSTPAMVMRSIGLQNYQTSKFINELFYPSFIDEFYNCDAETRRRILDEVHLTNYAGLAPPFLDELYYLLYRQRMMGQPVSQIRAMTEVTGARMDGDEVVLELRDRRSGKIEPQRCDLVLLGTGFDPQMPALVRDLAERVGLDGIEVSRRYRLELDDSAWGAIYLQGMNEATHGIADTLISVLAHRSQDIVDDMVDRRAVAEVRSA
ncbi:SidA/IucD/PvdA family monooxygenase [Nocardia terpenica]|uniref:lysine N(6)-hydroxylase/L-ornithine N(5)-oxygenase family protein n=1 Tax=Nocardia terpenica TaxID=455432 RepID=UPI001893182D|nr:SidA/IucD/PvdA family monooxygenase [Nocardia terpenica]MBF6059747.1 SidA/IucD/PvdA family monooxygenase [Nocardia terpenica]MBF6102712.1 SidA/IucD/PvdA family monooxygenase [Nocardia terpenica]MBF6111097.1 SidA/IucD/PvdA family monooxygenase [Nocardia terpenica]MBF6117228.1 SidA/IucD/PvdA family monooxygenase [Nocardia terpenica]MBF6150931.1 SidA/IucD/PvdA family monooxygenase [Nocardia terpenica]